MANNEVLLDKFLLLSLQAREFMAKSLGFSSNVLTLQDIKAFFAFLKANNKLDLLEIYLEDQ